METFGNVDSKFRFIILASKRAKQLLKGAKPKIELKSRNPVRIAQAEILENLVEYEIIPLTAEDSRDHDDRVFGEEGIPSEIGDVDDDVEDGDPIAAAAGDDEEDEDHAAEDEELPAEPVEDE